LGIFEKIPKPKNFPSLRDVWGYLYKFKKPKTFLRYAMFEVICTNSKTQKLSFASHYLGVFVQVQEPKNFPSLRII
jgi:hypothetical protein